MTVPVFSIVRLDHGMPATDFDRGDIDLMAGNALPAQSAMHADLADARRALKKALAHDPGGKGTCPANRK